HYWYPKVFGRRMSETLGKIQFYLMTPGFLTMAFGQMGVGLLGMRRRIADYDPTQGFDTAHLVITIAGFVTALSVLVFFFNMVYSARRGKVAVGNIWRSRSPEWQIPSPLPMHNFETPIRVVGEPYDYSVPDSTYIEVAPQPAGD
ncbi:MAG: cytochrome C oxidase subunit I, partial [Chloroflexi bacterium]|nr:cytochrome C oxidase subunit I [Chloroflexota bacterium]